MTENNPEKTQEKSETVAGLAHEQVKSQLGGVGESNYRSHPVSSGLKSGLASSETTRCQRCHRTIRDVVCYTILVLVAFAVAVSQAGVWELFEDKTDLRRRSVEAAWSMTIGGSVLIAVLTIISGVQKLT